MLVKLVVLCNDNVNSDKLFTHIKSITVEFLSLKLIIISN